MTAVFSEHRGARTPRAPVPLSPGGGGGSIRDRLELASEVVLLTASTGAFVVAMAAITAGTAENRATLGALALLALGSTSRAARDLLGRLRAAERLAPVVELTASELDDQALDELMRWHVRAESRGSA